jgi:hypothetical protein
LAWWNIQGSMAHSGSGESSESLSLSRIPLQVRFRCA